MYPTGYPSDDPLLLLGKLITPNSWPWPLATIWMLSPIWAPLAQWALQSRNRRWSLALATLVLFFPGTTYALVFFRFDFDYDPFSSWLNFWVRATGFSGGVFFVFWFFTGIGLVLWIVNILVARRKGNYRSSRVTKRLLVFSGALFVATLAPAHYLATYETLEDAVREGDLALAEKRLRFNLLGVDANTGRIVEISSTPPLTYSLLPVSVENEDIEMTRLLLNHGARVDGGQHTHYTFNPVLLAIQRENTDILAVLLAHGANPNEGLHEAARANRVDVLQLLVEWGADVRTPGLNGRTLLDTAALAKAEDAMEFLSPYNLELTDYMGLLCSDQLERFRRVIEGGAAKDRWNSGSDEFRHELLRKAVQCDSAAVIEYLLAHGVAPRPLEGGNTLLHEAAKHGAVAAAKLLIESGISPNVSSESGQTPLGSVEYICFRKTAKDFVELLLMQGADPNLGEGTRPLARAVEHLHAESVQLLLEHGAELDGDPNYKSLFAPLMIRGHIANRSDLLNTAKVLVAFGADPTIPVGPNGEDALVLAKKRRYAELAEFLRSAARNKDSR